MGARGKLNVAYFNGCLLLAAAGLAAQSWAAFALTLAVTVFANVYVGHIRPARRH